MPINSVDNLWSSHWDSSDSISSALLIPTPPPQPVLPPKLKEWVSHNVGQLKVPFSSLPPALSFLHNGPLPSSLAHLTHQANRLVIPEHIKLIPPLGLCADTSLARNILLPVFPWLVPLVTQLKCFLLREAFSTTLVGACQPLQYIIPVVISALHWLVSDHFLFLFFFILFCLHCNVSIKGQKLCPYLSPQCLE